MVSAAGVAATERLVCFVDTDGGGGGGAVTGWSLLDTDGAGADSGFVYARNQLGDGAGSHTFAIGGGADGAAMLIAVDGSPDVDDTAASTGTGTNLVAGSVTAGVGPDRELVVWWKTWSHVDQTTAAITAPDGMTVVEGADNVASGAGWGRRSIATETVGAGATGTRTATSDPGNRWVALSVVLSGTDPDGGQQVDLVAVVDAVADAAGVVARDRALTAVSTTADGAIGAAARVRSMAAATGSAASAADGTLELLRPMAGTAAAAGTGDGALAAARGLTGRADAAADAQSIPAPPLPLAAIRIGPITGPAGPTGRHVTGPAV